MNAKSIAAAAMSALLFTAACAAGSSGPGADAQGTMRIGGNVTVNSEVDITRANVVIEDSVLVDPAAAWAALPFAFQGLALPLSERDQVRRRLAVNRFQPRRIENQPLSRYLDCGQGLVPGPIADSYQIDLWVETKVVASRSDPTKATVQTTVSANATPIASSGNSVTCASKGTLERRIAELMHQRIAASP